MSNDPLSIAWMTHSPSLSNCSPFHICLGEPSWSFVRKGTECEVVSWSIVLTEWRETVSILRGLTETVRLHGGG